MDVKCLFCASEALPFCSSGGLGEVAGSLPHALRELFIGCRVVIPLYKCIPEDLRKSMKFLTSFYVPVAWRNQYCGIFRANYNGVIYYLIDNEYYFNRPNMYGYFDDAERFSFFSRAILEMLPHIKFRPDIIHANDWQSALVPVYFSAFYAQNEFYSNMKTIFTIHNIEYQGKYGYEVFNDLIGLNQKDISLLDFDGCINFMKGAIETANVVTTVSPTYSQEILNDWFAHGLAPILNARSYKLHGILNGIDTELYNPSTDPLIYKTYSEKHLSDKVKNKILLQDRLHLDKSESVPVIGMVTRLVEHKGVDLVISTLETIMKETNVQFVILGSGEKNYEDFFSYMQYKYPNRICACHGFVPELAHKIYAGSDMFLMPSKSEPCGLSQMIALRYGSIPIVRETGGLKDSVSDSGDGCGVGFRFKKYDPWDMYDSIKRALAGYYIPEGWTKLVKRAMNCNNSWNHSAKNYLTFYKK